MTAIVNPGGTNEKFARANLKKARILVHPDNVTIFQQIVDGKADLMMTDAIEARLQSRLHPELCAVHPQQPFDFAEGLPAAARRGLQALRRPVAAHR